MLSTQFIKNPFTSRFCEQMNVPGTHDRQVAAYLIGTPNPSSITNPGFMAVCFNCARSIVEKLPDELLKHVDVEKALGLMDEEAKDALFDKLFPAAEPAEALEALLAEMEEIEIAKVLLKLDYTVVKTGYVDQPLIGMTEQQAKALAEPEQQDILKCPHCTYETWSPTSRRGHISAKHGKGKK